MPLCFVKYDVDPSEYKIHKDVYDLDIILTPKPILYDADKRILVLEHITGMSVSDLHGEGADLIAAELFERIRSMVRTLAERGIEYRDITGYNFMMDDDGRLWIIDFEHAARKEKITDDFVDQFLRGRNAWNEEFR